MRTLSRAVNCQSGTGHLNLIQSANRLRGDRFMEPTVKGTSFQPAHLLWIIPIIFLACIAQSGVGADTRPAPRNEASGAVAAPRAQSSGNNSTSAPAGQARPSAPAASSGSTALLTPNGSAAGTANGDYVSASSGGLNTFYRFFIEVPPGLSRLVVELFDPDIGLGGANEDDAGRDRDRNGSYGTAVTYTLIDPAGAARPALFDIGDATRPVGGDNAWLALYNGTGNNVLDTFSSVSYTNNNGNHNWSGGWIESDSGGAGPNSGAVAIVGGQLRVQDSVPGTPSIEREANLSATGLNLQVAYLTFNFSGTALVSGDALNVQVSNNGGASYTTLETLTDTSTGTSRSYNITSFIATNTRVRFIVAGGLNNTTNFFSFDNVQIYDGGTLTAGHWELRVDMSSAVTAGEDINA